MIDISILFSKVVLLLLMIIPGFLMAKGAAIASRVSS